MGYVLVICIYDFEFVSCFDIRISNFQARCVSANFKITESPNGCKVNLKKSVGGLRRSSREDILELFGKFA